MKKLLFFLLAISLLGTSCADIFGRRVRGNGNIKSEERSVSSFKNVEVSGAIDLYVRQGESAPVKIETDENLMQYIVLTQEGNKIVIHSKEGVNLHPSTKIKVYVTAPLYNEIEVSGASNIIGQNKISNAEDIKMEVSGAGDINMELNAPAVSAAVSGAGTVNLRGETKKFDLELSGASKAHCYELLSENTKVDITGAGDADVYASSKLDAEVSGAGNVSYKGGAATVNQQVSGAGSVKKVN
jgi:hypothetical protein